jgi:hypothetical protein
MKPASESQGTLTRIWAKRGTRPRITRDRRFTWAARRAAPAPPGHADRQHRGHEPTFGRN